MLRTRRPRPNQRRAARPYPPTRTCPSQLGQRPPRKLHGGYSDDICYTEFYVGTIIADASTVEYLPLRRRDYSQSHQCVVEWGGAEGSESRRRDLVTVSVGWGGRYYSLARGTDGGQQQWRRRLVCELLFVHYNRDGRRIVRFNDHGLRPH
jgi:hypothetical protein